MSAEKSSRDDRHWVATADELSADGSRVIVEAKGREIAVFRVEGEYYAVLNYCVHESGPLCEGELKGCIECSEDGWWKYDETEKYITCPWHGWQFDVTTGETIPGGEHRVPTFDVEVEDDDVYVRI